MKVSERCKAKQLKATAYEYMLWSACREIIINPQAVIPAAKGFYEKIYGETQNLSNERKELQQQLQEVIQQHSRAMQLFIRQGGNLQVVETEIDRFSKEKSQLEYKLAQIDQRKDLVEIQKSFIDFTEKLLDDSRQDLSMIDESEHFDTQDSRYVSGRIMKTEIIQGLISRIICLTHVKDGKKEADLKVHFRLGKEMSAKEWLRLGGIPAKMVEESGAGSVSDFLAGALGNCNVGADV